MMRQETEWGYIDWEYLPDPKNPKRWFSVGKTTILPGRRQPPHVHYGYEQLLYVLSGEADARFNGVDVHAKAGNYYILEADTTHEAVNHGPEPILGIVSKASSYRWVPMKTSRTGCGTSFPPVAQTMWEAWSILSARPLSSI